jgi:hypothetical protein
MLFKLTLFTRSQLSSVVSMIGNGVGIGCVVRCRRIDLRYWDGHQFPGARDVGLAAGAGQ